MDSRRIKFAKEFCFDAILEDGENKIRLGLTKYQLLENALFLWSADGEFVRVGIPAKEAAVMNELQISNGRALLRGDKADGEYIAFTLLEFSKSVSYDKDNPFRIVVDEALAADLKMNHISREKAVREIEKQIVVEENGRYCFAYARGNGAEELEIVGDNYSFVIAQTPQKYLHITQMRPRVNRTRIDFPVVLMSGSIEIVDELNDRAILTARTNEQYSELISSDAEFIQLWNIYNELELESIKRQAAEMGWLKYRKFRYAEGMLIFSLEGGYTRREFCVDNMYYAAIEMIDPEHPMEYPFREAVIVGTEIDDTCVNTSEFRIKEDMDAVRTIPEKGYLLPSISGSEIQNKRRLQAQKNILANKCRLVGLKNIIQGGALAGAAGRRRQPVSSDLEKKIFGDREHHFTEKQKLALDAAINTPDIAVIQGPPGTGKTTIIKALISRIEELWDSGAKILITSTQHDAVDNVSAGISYGGVPANRISVRRGKESENWQIYDWIDNMISSCENWLKSTDGNERSTVREIFEKLVRVESTKKYEEKYQLLKECCRQTESLGTDPELDRQFTRVLAELAAKAEASKAEGKHPLRALLDGQRLHKEAYLDDGIAQLKRLEQYLKYDSDLEFEIPAYWKKLRRITKDCGELEGYLGQFRADCERLEVLCPDSGDVDEELLESDINGLIKNIRLEMVALGNRK